MAKKNSEKDSLMEAVSKELKSNFDLNKFSKVIDRFRVYKMEKFLLIACFK
jgi:hypothetical protein